MREKRGSCELLNIGKGRKRMRRCTIAVLVVALSCLSLFAQGGNEKGAAVAENPAKSVNHVVRDESKYVKMSMAELYDAALKEGGKVVVYSVTGTTAKAITGFKKEYPGIEIENTKLKAADIFTKVELEGKSGNYYGDLLLSNDGLGRDYMEWYTNGSAVAYTPECIKHDLIESMHPYGYALLTSPFMWFYNNKAFPNGCPITNIWDLVEKDAKGNYKYKVLVPDFSVTNILAQFCVYTQKSDDMAAAYKAKYGKDLVYTYDAKELGVAEPNNAGYEWMYRLIQAHYEMFTDANEALESVSTSTAEAPAICYVNGLKLSDAREAGQTVAFITTMGEFDGVLGSTYIYVVPKSDNPAGARLLAMYFMGGEDGKGSGYEYFMSRPGTYPTRKSYNPMKYNDMTLDDTKAILPDIDYIYGHYLDVQDFWTYYADKLK